MQVPPKIVRWTEKVEGKFYSVKLQYRMNIVL